MFISKQVESTKNRSMLKGEHLMKRRLKKKLIPANTDYCYHLSFTDKGEPYRTKCPHLIQVGIMQDAIIDANGQEHSCERPLLRCAYLGVTNEEEYLLDDSVKVCGERTSYFPY